MNYIGLQAQQRRNNIRSLMLLLIFPCLVVGLTFLFAFFMAAFAPPEDNGYAYITPTKVALEYSKSWIPTILIGVATWFFIAYFVNTRIIRKATGARPLQREENMRVYNLVENLCMSRGMTMPKVNIIEDDSLNAYASGINQRTYTVTLSRGIIDKLDDPELEGVIAHELSHIRNRDVRLLIVSIVFVGIFAMIAQIAGRLLLSSGRSRSSKNGGGVIIALVVVAVLALVGLFFTSLMRFAISRKREYLADASAADMTHNPLALASALRKISRDPDIEAVTRSDVAQLFIEHPAQSTRKKRKGNSLFATHPPIEQRIAVLEQF